MKPQWCCGWLLPVQISKARYRTIVPSQVGKSSPSSEQYLVPVNQGVWVDNWGRVDPVGKGQLEGQRPRNVDRVRVFYDSQDEAGLAQWLQAQSSFCCRLGGCRLHSSFEDRVHSLLWHCLLSNMFQRQVAHSQITQWLYWAGRLCSMLS